MPRKGVFVNANDKLLLRIVERQVQANAAIQEKIEALADEMKSAIAALEDMKKAVVDPTAGFVAHHLETHEVLVELRDALRLRVLIGRTLVSGKKVVTFLIVVAMMVGVIVGHPLFLMVAGLLRKLFEMGK